MDEVVSCNERWPDETRMPVGRGLPEDLLLLWEVDGWSCASLVVTVAGERTGSAEAPDASSAES